MRKRNRIALLLAMLALLVALISVLTGQGDKLCAAGLGAVLGGLAGALAATSLLVSFSKITWRKPG